MLGASGWVHTGETVERSQDARDSSEQAPHLPMVREWISHTGPSIAVDRAAVNVAYRAA